MQSTPSPREDGRVTTTVDVLQPEPGVHSAPSPREDGLVAATVGSLPPEPDVRSTPSPREVGRTGAVSYTHLTLPTILLV